MATVSHQMAQSGSAAESSGEMAVLPLTHVEFAVHTSCGIARVECTQRFRNDSDLPLRVTYSLPLPADAAVSGFEFQLGARHIVGQVDGRKAARERFEEALIEGKSAALLDEERSSLFSQELGNIPARTEVVAKLVLDQPLAWTLEGWEWRFPTTLVPRYLGDAERVADGARVTPPMIEGLGSPRATLTFETTDATAESGVHASHPLTVRVRESGLRCELVAAAGLPLDRDLVVRFRPAEPGARLSGGKLCLQGQTSEECFGLVSLVPPAGAVPSVARDAIVLLDTSGSMAGRPLEQARRVVLAFLDTLSEDDSLELIEFSNQARRWRETSVPASRVHLEEARHWLASLRASGSTEMEGALERALAPLRADAQRQVILVTDGAVGFEREVLATLSARLPVGSRLHTVGVGSAVNRSLTMPAARAGRGVEVIVGLDDDVEPAAQRLVARTKAPLLVDLKLEGDALLEQAPARLPDLFAGAPVRAALKLKPGGELRATGRMPNGELWQEQLRVEGLAEAPGRAAAALFARERVEDLELEMAAGADAAECEARIEAIGLSFQIATRVTSWFAVSEEPSVDPGEPTRHVRMPHALPYGVSAEGLGLRAASASATRRVAWGEELVFGGIARSVAPAARGPAPRATASRSPAAAGTSKGLVERFEALFGRSGSAKPADEAPLTKQGWGEAPSRFVELSGKRRLRKPRVLVIDVELAVELLFTRPSEVSLEWADGSASLALWDPAKSTRPGKLEPGSILRLWLATDRDLPGEWPSRVRAYLADVELLITVEAESP